VQLQGLATYLDVVIAPRRAFARLAGAPTWGWAALCGLALTLVAVLVSERAQLHLLALSEAHRLAALPPGERLSERIAAAQVAPMRPALFVIGALVAPWLYWSLLSVFFFLAAAIGRGQARLGSAWVLAINSYAPYGIAGVINALLVAVADPASLTSATSVVRLPSPRWLVHDDPRLAGFLSAYHVGDLWYLAIVALALHTLMRLSWLAALLATVALSLLFGLFASFAAGGAP